MARPRRAGPAKSIFISTVIDHAKPWLMPRRTFAITIQDHVGAQMMRNGTGIPHSQPNTSTGLRPHRSAIGPETRSTNAFIRPKLTIKAVMADVDASRNP